VVFSRKASQGILAAWLIVVAAAGATASLRFRIDNSVSVWFGAADPGLATWRRAVEDFGGREWLLVVLDQGGASRPDADRHRDSLSTAIARLPNAGMVISAANAPDTSALVRTLLRPDPAAGRQALLVQVTNDLDRQDNYREVLLDDLRALTTAFPSVRDVHIAGTAAINGELNRAARHDMMRFFPAVMLLMTLVGALVFRNVRDTVALLATALATVTLAAGALAAAGHPLNMVTIMLPTILIAVSVADGVHVIHGFHHHRSIGEALSAVWKPSFGTTATTVAGFLGFAGSDVLPIRQLALYGAFGVTMAYVLAFTLTPALLILLWGERAPVRPVRRPTMFAGFLAILHRAPRTVVATAAGAAVLLGGLAFLRADTDYAAFFRDGTRVPADYAAMRQAGFPVNALNLVVNLPDGPGSLASGDGTAISGWAKAVGELPSVRTVLSPFTLAALGGDPSLLVDAGMVSRDGRQLQLVVMTDGTSSRELLGLTTEIDSLARQLLPATITAVPTGTPFLWARMDEGVIRTQRESLLFGCVVCFALLLWLFRSFGLAALALAVSLYPGALVLGLMGLLEIPLNLATVLIAGIAIGITVDDTIHYLHAWQLARRAGESRGDAARTASSLLTGRIVATSAILIGAFLVMGLSGFLPTAQFGLLSSLTILLALAADLALVPVLLAWGSPTARAV